MPPYRSREAALGCIETGLEVRVTCDWVRSHPGTELPLNKCITRFAESRNNADVRQTFIWIRLDF